MRAAIIGCGAIAGGYDEGTAATAQAMTHARAYQLAGVEILGVFDPATDRARKFAATWAAKNVFSSLEELSAAAPDIISICSPNETHFSVFQSLMKGSPKALVCEKPIAMSVADADSMIAAAAGRGIHLGVNYMRRWDRRLSELGQEIASGRWGALQNGRVVYTKGLFHNASHAINLLMHWFGKFDGAQALALKPAAMSGDVIGSFSIRLERAPEILFQAMDASRFNTFEIDLYFERGRVRLPSGGATVEIFSVEEGVLAGEPAVSPGTLEFATKEMISNVIDCARGKSALKMKAGDARDTLAACEAVRMRMGGKNE